MKIATQPKTCLPNSTV
ncbi:UNVERIFIED_CONTAM: hypothetical protein GTU68_052659 [Idotea baltica]|nr:hypothetical protein [Idotea baltica]